ncbi:efflux RND transporter periplasmic adaptor subunit [Rhodoferax sp. BAB1]|uniref:efflux RND transporter periplasmic adaptor subunit n=1 Tax=Rhodoferax sp. BAB1 TaxID=2741720 RepID=UPI0015765270|nr:efflux RND transporter periplasmic adaptor subunit [Rhodoferax sp. BAB1]QKO20557.1 efflux RND transporter periplasmic adaptor subunit [Rhodoferax sp. BAB1]
MNELRKSPAWLPIAGTAVFAAVIGFGAAKLLAPKAPPAAQAEQGESNPAEATAGDQIVKIPAQYLAAAQISVEALRSGRVASEVLAPATVVAPPGSEAVIVARAAGILTKIEKRIGDTVRAGEVLAVVESMQAAAMVSDMQVAETRADAARRTFEREKKLFEEGITPRQDMEAAEATLNVTNAEARRAISVARAARVTDGGQAITVVSPITGRITAQRSVLGTSVTPDAELFRVVDTNSVQVEASVTAADTRRIATGDQATIIFRSSVTINARVRSVTPTVTGDARAATVLLVPEGRSKELVIGEGVQVRLHTSAQGSDGFMVPEDAIQRIAGRDAIFVQTAEGFTIVPVLVGVRSNGVAQIISGVKGDELVATRNAFLLKAEMIKLGGDKE